MLLSKALHRFKNGTRGGNRIKLDRMNIERDEGRHQAVDNANTDTRDTLSFFIGH